ELASDTLADLEGLTHNLPARAIASYEVINLLRVSRTIVAAAQAREESRGAHTRSDFPNTADALAGRFVVRGSAAPVFVALPPVAVGRARS
ncbi:MAG TPA: L-aspartate oxidase, partial [Acidimicrobiia bacterium]|nr:L-aspartate oxidase [Acidimicrobiia bacterium]